MSPEPPGLPKPLPCRDQPPLGDILAGKLGIPRKSRSRQSRHHPYKVDPGDKVIPPSVFEAIQNAFDKTVDNEFDYYHIAPKIIASLCKPTDWTDLAISSKRLALKQSLREYISQLEGGYRKNQAEALLQTVKVSVVGFSYPTLRRHGIDVRKFE